MKVSILNVTKDPYDQRVYYKDALALVGSGHEVSIITSYPEEEITEDNIRIKPFTHKQRTLTSPFVLPARFISLFFLLKKAIQEDPDVYYCTEPDAWLVGLGAKIFTNSKVILNVLEHYPGSISFRLPKIFRKPAEVILGFITRFFARFADHVIFAGNGLRQIFNKLPDNKSTVVLNCSKYQSPRPAEKHLGKGEATFKVIFVGMMTKTRGSEQIRDALIDSIKKDSEITLEIVGDFFRNGKKDDEYRRSFESSLEVAGVSDNFSVTSWIPFKEVREHLEDSDVGLFLGLPANKNNNYGPAHKMFDYMSAGIPIIASKYLAYKDMISDNSCGILVDPYKPKEISEAILYLKRNPEKAREMGLNGWEAAEEKFNWKEEEKKLIGAFEGLI